jgi:uncharacterized membrane protein
MALGSRQVRVNFLYGLIALIPIALLGLIGYYLYSFWTLVFVPLSDELGLTDNQSRLVAAALAIPCFFLVCIVLGALIRTSYGSAGYEFVERFVLKPIPGYDIVANLLRGFADRSSKYPAALVDLGGNGVSVPAFIMENDQTDRVTVFVPMAPLMSMGVVHLVDRDRVEILHDATMDTANHIGQWGIGLQKMIARRSRGSSQTKASGRKR